MIPEPRTWITLKDNDVPELERLVYFIRTEMIENRMLFEEDVDSLINGVSILESWIDRLKEHEEGRQATIKLISEINNLNN